MLFLQYQTAVLDMLQFTIESSVPQSFELVSTNFSEELFRALAPAFPPSELLLFDGDRVGGLVKIKLGVGILSTVWVSEIISRTEDDDKVEFVDVGLELPPPLQEWRHRHMVKRNSDGSTLIVDDIQFSSGFKALDYILYPVLKTMFSMRTPAYLKYYNELVVTPN